PNGCESLFSVFDGSVQMPCPRAVDLTISKNNSQDPLQDETHHVLIEKPEADAMFWSASAIEKFVIPYYVAHRLFDGPTLSKLETDYKSGNVVAVLHVRPSLPFEYTNASESEYMVFAKKGMLLGNGPVDLLEYVKGI